MFRPDSIFQPVYYSDAPLSVSSRDMSILIGFAFDDQVQTRERPVAEMLSDEALQDVMTGSIVENESGWIQSLNYKIVTKNLYAGMLDDDLSETTALSHRVVLLDMIRNDRLCDRSTAALVHHVGTQGIDVQHDNPSIFTDNKEAERLEKLGTAYQRAMNDRCLATNDDIEAYARFFMKRFYEKDAKHFRNAVISGFDSSPESRNHFNEMKQIAHGVSAFDDYGQGVRAIFNPEPR